MLRSIVAALSLILIPLESVHCRLVSFPGYEELFAKSDFVVIAEPVSKTRDTREHIVLAENISPGVSAVGVVTDFKPLLVLKGARRQHFTLHHYRLAESGVIIDPPTFTTYKPGDDYHPFLMFLVREPDGRFAPVAGQVDPAMSVQQLSHYNQ